jgi:hypothetical protein
MEIKLYTAKEAKEIIKKYPDKMLRTKCVVVDLVVDSDGIEHEKRMFYIVERIRKRCFIYTVIFKED